jgi:hypothetical protein
MGMYGAFSVITMLTIDGDCEGVSFKAHATTVRAA